MALHACRRRLPPRATAGVIWRAEGSEGSLIALGRTGPKEASTTKLGLKLPRTREAPRLARQRLAEWVRPDLDGPELDDAKLLVTELVTNAVVHGRGWIEIRAELDENRLLVEVVDQGQGFERIVREHDFDRVGGRGLNLVDALASRWGVHDGSGHVWFELERRGPRLGPAQKPAS